MEHWSWNYLERPKRIITGVIHKILKYDNSILIQKDINKHRNELVLNSFEVVRLLGWTDQYEEDYYWVVYDLNNEMKLISCVCGFIWLKNRLSIFEYNHLKYVFELNTQPLEEILNKLKENSIILK